MTAARLRWHRPLAIAALFLLAFGLMRAALLVAHRPAFADLSALQVAGGFLHGVRFDNAFEAGSVAEGLLVLNAPFSAYHSTRNTRRVEVPRHMPTDEAIRVVRSRYAPADQTSAFVDAESLPRRHSIPALLVGPGIPKGEVDTAVASQMDILPTIVDYLGWRSAHASFGESLIGSRRPDALLKNGDLMLRVGPDGWISHDLTRRLDGAGTEAEQIELERYLLAETQLLAELLSTNRIYSGD